MAENKSKLTITAEIATIIACVLCGIGVVFAGIALWSPSRPAAPHASTAYGGESMMVSMWLVYCFVVVVVFSVAGSILFFIASRRQPFSPLQVEAFRLARDLRALVEEQVGEHPHAKFTRLRLEYEHKFAPRVKEIIYEFAQLNGGEDSTLRRHIQYIDNQNDILNVANSLIHLSHMQNGIDCTQRYP